MANAAKPKAAKITNTARAPPDMPPKTANQSVKSFIEASELLELRFFWQAAHHISRHSAMTMRLYLCNKALLFK
jgi:hypothetical protein